MSKDSDNARDIILRRRRKFVIASAVAGSIALSSCDKQSEPCLNVAAPEDEGAEPQPCLDVAPPEEPRDAGTADSADAGAQNEGGGGGGAADAGKPKPDPPPRPCLRVAPPPKPRPKVCLLIVKPPDKKQ